LLQCMSQKLAEAASSARSVLATIGSCVATS
jgi:hypothetical protein